MRATAAAVLFVLTASALAGDIVEMDGGRVMRGEIVREETSWVGIEIEHEIVWLRRSEIASIRRNVKPAPPTRPAKTPDAKPAADGERGHEDRAAEDHSRSTEPERKTASTGERTASGDAPTEKKLSAEGEIVRRGLRSEIRAERVKAAAWIVETWPKWRSAIEYALTQEKSETARVEAAAVLDREGVTDVVPLVETALRNASPAVRASALRVARHRKLTALEPRALELMRNDPTWRVRQEAIRTLEDIGGALCLPHVMSAWSAETDRNRKRRYRRVMANLLGDDFGDDSVGWYGAAEELLVGTRKLRDGKVNRPRNR